MEFKLSKYNQILEKDGENYLWNTFTNAFIKVDENATKWMKDFDGSDINSPFFRILEENGCIVQSNLDETNKIIYEEKKVMLDYMPETLNFTIAPGLGCNYNCFYCFEKDHVTAKMMSQDVINATEKFIIGKMESNPRLKNLNIRWFGGEPLMYMDKIEEMSDVLIGWCKNHNITYSAGIVTNGRYLSREKALILKRLHVAGAQLSMDGISEYYEKQKGASEGDFDCVVDNIKNVADILKITIRINIENDLDEALKLTRYLLKDCKLDGKIQIYVAHIRDYEGRTTKEEQISHEKFLKLEGDYISLFGNAGEFKQESLGYIKPKRRCTTCKSVCGSNFCIGPEGELYRCEHHYGMADKVVGNVNGTRVYTKMEMGYLKYVHYDKCLECKVFPICLGGCMNDNKEGEPVLACNALKARLAEYALRMYLNK